MDVSAQILDASGALVLDVSTGGYEVIGLNPGDRTWRTIDASSPFVDGVQTVAAVLDSTTLELVVRVRGASWVQVEQRYQALLAAISQQSWLFSETSQAVTKVWRVNRPADSMSKQSAEDLSLCRRDVTVPIRVEPTPTITGI
jgi:PAS domain-containing protein